MKRAFVLCLCLALFACAPAAQQGEMVRPTAAAPIGSPVDVILSEPATMAASAAPEPDRFPVVETVAALPTTVEPVNLEDHLLIYESNGATYLYAYGESILLHQGGMYAYSPYNYLTEGTALTFIEPSDGTLRILDLDDPHKTPVTVDPDAVNDVALFATSQSGNEFLFLKYEDERLGVLSKGTLYLYKNGEVKRIEESRGFVDRFSLSLDGKSLYFYINAIDDSVGDYLMLNEGELIQLPDPMEDISDDFRTALTLGKGVLTLYRDGFEPVVLSKNSEMIGCRIEPDGMIRWVERDHTYWQFDGIEKKKLLEDVESPKITESGMFVFFRDGSLYVQFGDDEPLLICAKEANARVILSYILDGGKRIVYGTVLDAHDAKAYMHMTNYAVTVDRSGISQPTLISDDNYTVIPFRDDYIVVKTKTDKTITFDLYFKDKLVGVVDDLWNDYHVSGAGENELLFFRNEGRLCCFDGARVTVILNPNSKPTSRRLDMLENGTFLYRDGDAIYYFDGAAFHRILEGVNDFEFAPFLKDALGERWYHE